jgi:hypothetical protein
MRALRLAVRLWLPLLSAALYALYALATHRGLLTPELVAFLISFLPFLGFVLYREVDFFFFLWRRVRLRLHPGRVTAAISADFRIPERLSESEALEKALEALRERFPDSRILRRSRGEIILETETAPLLLRVDRRLEEPGEEAPHLFIGQLGRSLGVPAAWSRSSAICRPPSESCGSRVFGRRLSLWSFGFRRTPTCCASWIGPALRT